MSSTTAPSDLTTSLDGSETADRARRFGGIARLYGAPALAAFEGAHVAVIGIGGVGSWVAEALADAAWWLSKTDESIAARQRAYAASESVGDDDVGAGQQPADAGNAEHRLGHR